MKLFDAEPPSNAELTQLLQQAPAPTSYELWQQRVSFAYGNASLTNPAITREMVEQEAVRLYGPCPEKKQS